MTAGLVPPTEPFMPQDASGVNDQLFAGEYETKHLNSAFHAIPVSVNAPLSGSGSRS